MGLEICNHVRDWYKIKNYLGEVENSIMPIGNTSIHTQINLSVFINKVSFISIL